MDAMAWTVWDDEQRRTVGRIRMVADGYVAATSDEAEGRWFGSKAGARAWLVRQCLRNREVA